MQWMRPSAATVRETAITNISTSCSEWHHPQRLHLPWHVQQTGRKCSYKFLPPEHIMNALSITSFHGIQFKAYMFINMHTFPRLWMVRGTDLLEIFESDQFPKRRSTFLSWAGRVSLFEDFRSFLVGLVISFGDTVPFLDLRGEMLEFFDVESSEELFLPGRTYHGTIKI